MRGYVRVALTAVSAELAFVFEGGGYVLFAAEVQADEAVIGLMPLDFVCVYLLL